MMKRNRRVLRVLIVMVLALALSAVYVTSAQSDQLTQVVATKDGQISAHLPDGWLSQDVSGLNNFYSSALAFGDSTTSLQTAVDSMTANQTQTIPGISGVIAIVAEKWQVAYTPDEAITEIFNAAAGSVQQQGGSILKQQQVNLGDGDYPAIVGIGAIPSLQEEGYVGAFTDGASNLAFISVGASPVDTFTANATVLADVIDSIRVPAEAGGTNPQTVVATAVPSNNGTNGNQTNNSAGTQSVAATKGTFSVDLPQGWATQMRSDVDSFGDVVAFGTDQAALSVSNNSIIDGNDLTDFKGTAGFVGAVDVSQLTGAALGAVVDPLLKRLTENATSAGAQTVGDPQSENINGKYPGEIQELSDGYIAVMHSSDQVIVAIVISNDKASHDTEMLNIIESIQIPAAAGSTAAGSTQTGGQPQATETTSTEAATSEVQTYRSTDNRLSVDLPLSWTKLDNVADGDILAFGDTPDAAMSRLYSVKPDLATKTVISGNGGVIVLYPMSNFGIDPNNPDLMPLMQRALGNLKGYSVDQPPKALGSDGAVIATITGTEHGYLALIPFGDQIAYVTATGSTADEFNAMQDALMSIVNSVHIPALPIPTETPPPAGLGGLGGLEATEEAATPVVAATEESAGLGGLGGLGSSPVATPNATAEAGS